MQSRLKSIFQAAFLRLRLSCGCVFPSNFNPMVILSISIESFDFIRLNILTQGAQSFFTIAQSWMYKGFFQAVKNTRLCVPALCPLIPIIGIETFAQKNHGISFVTPCEKT